MRVAGAVHFSISPVPKIHGTGGVQGVLGGGGTVGWMPFQNRNRLASGGSANCARCFSEVSVPSLKKRRKRGRQGNVNALPPGGFWAGLGCSSS